MRLNCNGNQRLWCVGRIYIEHEARVYYDRNSNIRVKGTEVTRLS